MSISGAISFRNTQGSISIQGKTGSICILISIKEDVYAIVFIVTASSVNALGP